MPKDPPKHAKRKQIEEQAILTSEPVTMEKLENQKKKKFLKTSKPKNKHKRKGREN